MEISSSGKTKKQQKTSLLRRFLWKIVLVASKLMTLGLSQQTKAPIIVNSHLYSGGAVCEWKDVDTYFIGKTMRTKLVSYYINPSDPGKILALPDAGGTKKYQLVSRGTQCYTSPNAARYGVFGFILEYVADAQPENPGTDFTCKITKYILPTDLVPCNPLVTYMRLSNILTFTSGTSSLTYENLLKNSVINYSFDNIRKHLLNFIGISSNLVISSYFDDTFMEMLVAEPYSQGADLYFASYDMDNYDNIHQAFLKVGVTQTTANYLQRITYDSLPGWHFAVNPAIDNGKFAHIMSDSNYYLSRTYCYNLYFSGPNAMNNNNIGVLKYYFDHRFAAMTLIKYNYHFHIKKVGVTIKIEMRRVNSANDVTVLNTLPINIPFTKTDEFVHFGFCVGLAPLYYTTGTTMLIRIYEVLYGWHDNLKQITNTHYDILGDNALLTTEDSGVYASEVGHFQYSNYNDRALTQINNANIFGLRVLTGKGIYSAFPTVRIMKGEPNENRGGKCMYFGIQKTKCNAYAYQRKRGDLSEHTIYFGNYFGRYDENPVSKCLVAYDIKQCLVPVAGYNRDLTVKINPYDAYPMYLISEFEGSTPAAVALRQGRTKITDSLGVDYWIKCPGGCKFTNLIIF